MAPLPASPTISHSINPEPLATISDQSPTETTLLATPILSSRRRFCRALRSMDSPRTQRLCRTRAWRSMHNSNTANWGKFFFYPMTLICPSYFVQAYLRKTTGYIQFCLYLRPCTAQHFRDVPRSPTSYPVVHSANCWISFLLQLAGMHFNQAVLKPNRPVGARFCHPHSRCSPEHVEFLHMARLHKIQT